MNQTSTKKMSKHNKNRALIRIQKELQYILRKTDYPKNIQKAIGFIVDEILK